MPHIEVVGAYPLTVTQELLDEAMGVKGHTYTDAFERELHADNVRGELESVALVEMIAHTPDKRFTIRGFGQSQTGKKSLASNDQAAYDHRFLSADGNSIITFSKQLLLFAEIGRAHV